MTLSHWTSMETSLDLWLLRKLDEAGLKQVDLASWLYGKGKKERGISRGAVSHWMAGTKKPSPEMLRQIVSVLKGHGAEVTLEEAFEVADYGHPERQPAVLPEDFVGYVANIEDQIASLKRAVGISENRPPQGTDSEDRANVLGEDLAERGILPGKATTAYSVKSGEKGNLLDDAPEGLISFEVESDRWSDLLEKGKTYPLVRWNDGALNQGEILLYKTADGYDARKYQMDSDLEGLERGTTFVVIGRGF